MALLAKLAVFDRLPEVLALARDCIKKNVPVCAVIAPTGSGKSLGIPHVLAREGYRIAVSVPTITAAKSLYARQKQLLENAGVKIEIGYAAEGEKNYSAKSRIIYGTSGHWRRKLLKLHSSTGGGWRTINFCDIFMLDEVHTGTVDVSMIQWLLADQRKSGKLHPLLMLSSATFDADGIPNLVLEMKTFPVEEEYIPVPHDDDLHEAILKRIQRSDAKEGDILVFLAGSSDVESLIKDAERSTFFAGFHAVPAYGNLDGADIDKIYQPAPTGKRKVVVATNIAETSITITGIGLVIDSMQEKRPSITSIGGNALVPTRVSKTSATQRRGRTGRDRPGRVVRMISKDSYEFLENTRPLEILSVPLEGLILELLGHGLNPISIFDSTIDKERISDSLELLRNLKMIDDNVKVTEKGSFGARLPLSVRSSAALFDLTKAEGSGTTRKAEDSGTTRKPNYYPPIAFIALIECYGPSYFYTPRSLTGDALNALILSRQDKYGSSNELISYAKVWNSLMKISGGLYKPLEGGCRKLSLNHRKCHEAKSCIKQLAHYFLDSGLHVNLTDFDEEEEYARLKPHIWTGYSDRLAQDTYLGYQMKSMTFRLNKKGIVSDVEEPRSVIALSTMSFPGKRGRAINVISLWVPGNVINPHDYFFTGTGSGSSSSSSSPERQSLEADETFLMPDFAQLSTNCDIVRPAAATVTVMVEERKAPPTPLSVGSRSVIVHPPAAPSIPAASAPSVASAPVAPSTWASVVGSASVLASASVVGPASIATPASVVAQIMMPPPPVGVTLGPRVLAAPAPLYV